MTHQPNKFVWAACGIYGSSWSPSHICIPCIMLVTAVQYELGSSVKYCLVLNHIQYILLGNVKKASERCGLDVKWRGSVWNRQQIRSSAFQKGCNRKGATEFLVALFTWYNFAFIWFMWRSVLPLWTHLKFHSVWAAWVWVRCLNEAFYSAFIPIIIGIFRLPVNPAIETNTFTPPIQFKATT